MSLKGNDQTEVWMARVEVHNSGCYDVTSDMFDQQRPILYGFNARILTVDPIENPSANFAVVDGKEDHVLRIGPDLFQKRQKRSVHVYFDGRPRWWGGCDGYVKNTVISSKFDSLPLAAHDTHVLVRRLRSAVVVAVVAVVIGIILALNPIGE